MAYSDGFFFLTNYTRDSVYVKRDEYTDNIIIDFNKVVIKNKNGSTYCEMSKHCVVPVMHFAVLSANEYIYSSLSQTKNARNVYVLWNHISYINKYDKNDIICINRQGDTYINKQIFDLTGLNKLKMQYAELQTLITENGVIFNDLSTNVHHQYVIGGGQFISKIEDLSTGYSLIYQDVSNINITVYDYVNGVYSKVEQTADRIKQTVNDVSRGMYSIIDQTAREIKQTVSDISAGVQSELDITAERVKMAVKGVSTVGAKNLLKDSDFRMYRSDSLCPWEFSQYDKISVEGIDVSVLIAPDQICKIQQTVKNIDDDQYTLSVYTKGGGELVVYVYNSDAAIVEKTFVSNGYGWTRCVVNFKTDKKIVNVGFVANNENLCICKPQLEHGAIATDWSVCSDDIKWYTDSMIDQTSTGISARVQAWTNTYDASMAELAMKEDEITRYVESDVELGTQNLLRDSNFVIYGSGDRQYWDYTADADVVSDAFIDDVSVVIVTEGKSVAQHIQALENYIYTFSGYFRSNVTDSVIIIINNQRHIITGINNIWRRFEFQYDNREFEANNNFVVIQSEDEDVYCTKVQLERGEIATDWTLNNNLMLRSVKSKLKQLADGITGEIDETYNNYMTRHSKLDVSVSGIETKVENVSVGITDLLQTAQKISFVAEDYVGMVNLLKGTDFSENETYLGECWTAFNGTLNYDEKLSKTILKSDVRSDNVVLKQQVELEYGEYYTVSFMSKGDQVLVEYKDFSGGTDLIEEREYIPHTGSEFGRSVFTFKVRTPKDATDMTFKGYVFMKRGGSSINNDFSIYDIKLEKGKVASAWRDEFDAVHRKSELFMTDESITTIVKNGIGDYSNIEASIGGFSETVEDIVGNIGQIQANLDKVGTNVYHIDTDNLFRQTYWYDGFVHDKWSYFKLSAVYDDTYGFAGKVQNNTKGNVLKYGESQVLRPGSYVFSAKIKVDSYGYDGFKISFPLKYKDKFIIKTINEQKYETTTDNVVYAQMNVTVDGGANTTTVTVVPTVKDWVYFRLCFDTVKEDVGYSFDMKGITINTYCDEENGKETGKEYYNYITHLKLQKGDICTDWKVDKIDCESFIDVSANGVAMGVRNDMVENVMYVEDDAIKLNGETINFLTEKLTVNEQLSLKPSNIKGGVKSCVYNNRLNTQDCTFVSDDGEKITFIQNDTVTATTRGYEEKGQIGYEDGIQILYVLSEYESIVVTYDGAVPNDEVKLVVFDKNKNKCVMFVSNEQSVLKYKKEDVLALSKDVFFDFGEYRAEKDYNSVSASATFKLYDNYEGEHSDINFEVDKTHKDIDVFMNLLPNAFITNDIQGFDDVFPIVNVDIHNEDNYLQRLCNVKMTISVSANGYLYNMYKGGIFSTKYSQVNLLKTYINGTQHLIGKTTFCLPWHVKNGDAHEGVVVGQDIIKYFSADDNTNIYTTNGGFSFINNGNGIYYDDTKEFCKSIKGGTSKSVRQVAGGQEYAFNSVIKFSRLGFNIIKENGNLSIYNINDTNKENKHVQFKPYEYDGIRYYIYYPVESSEYDYYKEYEDDEVKDDILFNVVVLNMNTQNIILEFDTNITDAKEDGGVVIIYCVNIDSYDINNIKVLNVCDNINDDVKECIWPIVKIGKKYEYDFASAFDNDKHFVQFPLLYYEKNDYDYIQDINIKTMIPIN